VVLTELLGSAQVAARPRDTVDVLVQTVTRRPAVQLANLAPLVIQAARDGEPTASAIVAEAAGQLADSVARVRAAEAADPIVLGGGLLTAGTPLAAAVRVALGSRWPGAALVNAGDGAVAAAWLAARTLPEVDAEHSAHLHRRLLPPTAASGPPTPV
jgi:N-acetylglucosamine kinase-like BadF-type ATPase